MYSVLYYYWIEKMIYYLKCKNNLEVLLILRKVFNNFWWNGNIYINDNVKLIYTDSGLNLNTYIKYKKFNKDVDFECIIYNK